MNALSERRERRITAILLIKGVIFGVPMMWLAWHRPLFVGLIFGGAVLGMYAFKYWFENLRNPFQ